MGAISIKEDEKTLVYDKEYKITGELLGQCIRVVGHDYEDTYMVGYRYKNTIGKDTRYIVEYTSEELSRLDKIPTPTQIFLLFIEDFIFSIKTHYTFNRKRFSNVRR